MTDNNNTPPTDAEVDAWVAGLNENDKAQLKQLQLQNAAVNRASNKAPTDKEVAHMSDADFNRYKQSLGIG